jgi:hypothetical protein
VLTTGSPDRSLRREPGEWAFIVGKPFGIPALAAAVNHRCAIAVLPPPDAGGEQCPLPYQQSERTPR